MTDLATLKAAAVQCEGDIVAARAALTRAADMLTAMRRQIDVLSAREAVRAQGGGSVVAAVAAGVEAQVGDFGGVGLA